MASSTVTPATSAGTPALDRAEATGVSAVQASHAAEATAARVVRASAGSDRDHTGPVQEHDAMPDTRLDIDVQKDGTVIVKVRDARTDKVVREIPPEDLIEFGRKLKRYLGLVLDRRA